MQVYCETLFQVKLSEGIILNNTAHIIINGILCSILDLLKIVCVCVCVCVGGEWR